MKDVIPILQSRIARRKKEYFKLMIPVYKDADVFGYSEYNKVRDGLKPNHPDVVALAKEQKQDKRILAEIVQLRREAKRQQRVKAICAALERCEEMSEQEVLEMERSVKEIDTILAARWGE